MNGNADTFAPFEERMRDEGLPVVAIDTFRHYHALLRAGDTGLLSAADIDPVDALPASTDLSGHADAGVAALDRAVILKLNGGLGTGMGMTRAKSLLPLKGGLTFLDIIARQTLHLRAEHDARVPLVLMNSFRTRADSLDALAAYPDLPAGVPADFLQHKVPKVLADDLSPAVHPPDPTLEWCPPGHGDIYPALATSGMLDALLAAGYQYAFVSNSDNLGAVLDLDILGWFADENIPFLMEVCDRTPADRKGGHLARTKDGRLVLREVAQCPEEEMDDFQNIARHRFFNTNSLWVNLPALAETLRERRGVLPLPMIVNAKTLNPADPASPAVFQLETAMGAAISVFEGARALRVPHHRFAPVKTTNDLFGILSDAWTLTEDHRVIPDPALGDAPPLITLDAKHYRFVDQLRERIPHGPPSLRECRKLTIRGDVRFGRHVTIRGEVTLDAGDTVREVPDGEVISS
ncbi:MAG: UTP--glucose-1-phosphate uridylyltransferase [Gemmatimonadota bacterium]|jgi:UTP--glucose-1-phosphate uridylyltransferase|nr:UTP--glucose-1-phosphate uridylyltransferase [Gemmatimonadota bacterium]MDP6801645.1 UTP--glucose-1-phosphate uridylyltransferase [Gemmatimonadota bacterium]MDP7030808.1 UTP--glucose-1-phosphate uridylyltransferase [Gemmatimonadota bacterium]